jgi:hypothetical protein
MAADLPGRAAAIFGILITSLMVLVKVLPLVPGHFTRYEWIALAIWAALGYLVHTRATQAADSSEKTVRHAEA